MNPRLLLCPVIAFFAMPPRAAEAAPGDVDSTFSLNTLNGDRGTINSLTALPDGRFIVGGNFTALNGTPSLRFARVSARGGLDTSYPVRTAPFLNFDEPVFCPVVMPDGKVYVSTPVRYNGNETYSFGRMNADGTLDRTYKGPLTGNVFTIWPLRDGSLVLGGDFTSADKPRYMLRLSPDGAVDRTFLPRVDGINSAVYSMAAQTDGKLVIGGTFTSVGGTGRKGIARVLPNGTLDRTFLPVMNDAEPMVRAVALQADGKVLLGGRFNKISNVDRKGLARLNADGTVDTTFSADISSTQFASIIYSIAVRTDGKILVAGAFEAVGGVERMSLALLNPDGSVVPEFHPAIYGAMSGVTLQADGKVLATGQWRTGPGGNDPLRDAQRYLSDPATEELAAVTPRRVRWLRGGSSPEADAVTFEISTDQGATWTESGDGARVEGGWEIAGLELPATGRIRAQARVSSGFGNGSRGLLETVQDFTLRPEIRVRDGGDASAPVLTDGQAAAVAYGTTRQGAPVERSFLLENPGNGDLRVTGITTPAGFSLVEAPGFPFTVLAGESRLLRLRLDAVAAGDITGVVMVSTDAANTAEFDFPVTGTVITPEITVRQGAGTAGPELTSGQTAAVDFGENLLGAPGVRNFTVVNDGSAPLLLQGVTVPEGYTLTLGGGAEFPATVAPGGTARLELALTSLVTGAHAGVVTIANDDVDESAFTFPVSGTVVTPEITVRQGAGTTGPALTSGQTAAVDFGANIQGTPGVREFTVVNDGAAPLTLRSGAAPEGYTLTLGGGAEFPATVAPGGRRGWSWRSPAWSRERMPEWSL